MGLIDTVFRLGCDFFERVHMYACTHWNSAYVLYFFCFRWPSLFFPDFLCDFVGWQGFRVCKYACAHVLPPNLANKLPDMLEEEQPRDVEQLTPQSATSDNDGTNLF